MNYSTWSNFLDLIRAGVFLFVAFESYFLARLYRMAWKEMKNSPIIYAMQLIFFSLCLMFSFLTFVALTNPFPSQVFEIVKDILSVPGIILYIALTRFREKSLDNRLKEISSKIKRQ